MVDSRQSYATKERFPLADAIVLSRPESIHEHITVDFLLAGMAQDLYNARLRRINISLDSLKSETFDGEALDLAALTIIRQWHVRFIEFTP